MTSVPHSQPKTPSAAWHTLTRVTREELGGGSPRAWLAHTLPAVFPIGTGGRLRAAVYRRLGMAVGRGTLIAGPLTIASGPGFHRRVRIGAGCYLNRNIYMDASDVITLGNGVSIGHHVVIITTDHAIGPSEFRAGQVRTAAVTIEDGAWVAAGVTLLPGVTVGRGAVIAAGAVVTKDVPPNTLAGGVPAKLIRQLSD